MGLHRWHCMPDEVLFVVRRIYMEMIHERDHVENNPKYTVSYREGYSEAVRCLGVIIKQLTSEDVR